MSKSHTMSAEKPTCGIIMPISAIGDCSETHWKDVKQIISDSIEKAGFAAHLVSEAQDIGVIQKRIVQNIYDNPVIVCDISCKNPNVMFELGMRLAFDKPTILIKDDKTHYNFDTNSIEHLTYPRDLRFANILEFIDQLSRKISDTYKASCDNPDFTTFLKHFGTFTVPKIETKEVPKYDYIFEELQSIRAALSKLNTKSVGDRFKGSRIRADFSLTNSKETEQLLKDFRASCLKVGLVVTSHDYEIGKDIINVTITFDTTNEGLVTFYIFDYFKGAVTGVRSNFI